MFFLMALLISLLLPLSSFFGFPGRKDVYRGMDGRRSIDKSHVSGIFSDRGPISVAFIGLSSMWVGTNARVIQKSLREHVRGDATAIMLGANHPGEDLIFILAKDLIDHHQVDLLLISVPNRAQPAPHPTFHRLSQISIHWKYWAGLSGFEKMQSLALASLGFPRQILSGLRHSCGLNDSRGTVQNNGSWIRESGWNNSKYKYVSHQAPELQFEDVYYDGSRYGSVIFQNVYTNYQEHYLRETVKYARRHNVFVAVLSTPIYLDRRSEKVVVRIHKEIIEDLGVPIIGIPPALLFKGLSDDEVKQFYYDVNHFNANGARLHTAAIEPIIREVWKKSAKNK
jgi:hypothetical protein